ncbi:endo-beta-N-acetylglucosaminidase [Sphingomonas sp. DT-51]|uniref:endo-beta-N-acetylglucosaminidase n=1 Tax=Sphingomonas sp. DT-51 TaxID=3396165 RepID=UPI003F1D1313
MADSSSTDSGVAAAHGTASIARRGVVIAGLGLLSSASLAALLGGARDGDDASARDGAAAPAERRPLGAGPASDELSGVAPILPLLPGGTADAFARLMAYDPAADPDAVYFRSTVPLAPRIAPFAATQAHPELDPRAGVATLATTNRTITPYAPDVWRAVRHAPTPAGGVQVARRLGVHDIVVQWGGTGIVPNPALTDAAHRNGALCLGTIWQPDARLFDGIVVPVERVAEKLVALAQYFGFDGYFVNHERGSAQAKAQVAGLMAAMHAAARRARVAPFHLQHYDGHGDLRDLFVPDASGAPAADTVMVDQGWSGYNGPGGCCTSWPADPATLAAGASAYGRSPEDVFFGLQLYPGPGFIGAAAPRVISPDGEKRAAAGSSSTRSTTAASTSGARVRRGAARPSSTRTPTSRRSSGWSTAARRRTPRCPTRRAPRSRRCTTAAGSAGATPPSTTCRNGRRPTVRWRASAPTRPTCRSPMASPISSPSAR